MFALDETARIVYENFANAVTLECRPGGCVARYYHENGQWELKARCQFREYRTALQSGDLPLATVAGMLDLLDLHFHFYGVNEFPPEECKRRLHKCVNEAMIWAEHSPDVLALSAASTELIDDLIRAGLHSFNGGITSADYHCITTFFHFLMPNTFPVLNDSILRSTYVLYASAYKWQADSQSEASRMLLAENRSCYFGLLQFYRSFWHLIGSEAKDFLLNAVEELSEQALTPPQTKGVVIHVSDLVGCVLAHADGDAALLGIR